MMSVNCRGSKACVFFLCSTFVSLGLVLPFAKQAKCPWLEGKDACIENVETKGETRTQERPRLHLEKARKKHDTNKAVKTQTSQLQMQNKYIVHAH